MKLKEIAHSRTGDKGDMVNISVIAFDEKDYPIIQKKVTAEKVKLFLGETIQNPDLGACRK